MAFQIETGVPIPAPRSASFRGTAGAARALAEAPIGASMFIPLVAGRTQRDHSVRIASQFNSACGPGWFTARAASDGVRIWKIAEPKGARRQAKAA